MPVPPMPVTAEYRASMPTTLCRTLRYGALALVTVLATGVLCTMFVYHSINIFTPPERIESLGRTYTLSCNNHAGYSREGIDQRHHTLTTTLEQVGCLWPRHPAYQFQNDLIRGQATTTAYLKRGDRHIPYSLSGTPKPPHASHRIEPPGRRIMLKDSDQRHRHGISSLEPAIVYGYSSNGTGSPTRASADATTISPSGSIRTAQVACRISWMTSHT